MRQPTTFALLTVALLGASALAIALLGTGCEARDAPRDAATTATTPGPSTPKLAGSSDERGSATKVAFTVEGMHCQGCVDGITTKVAKIEGVRDCAVSLDDREAVVTVSDPTVAAVILETIAKLGYTVEEKPIDEASTEG